MVPTPGVEPGQAFARRILSPLRLPIPPGGQRFHPGRLWQPGLRRGQGRMPCARKTIWTN